MMEGSIGYVGTLIDILHLETAFLEEPVLEASHDFVHVHLLIHIEIEEVVRADEIEVFCNPSLTVNIGQFRHPCRQ